MRILASVVLASSLFGSGLFGFGLLGSYSPASAEPVGLVQKLQKTAYGTPPAGARTPKQPTDGVEFNELIETVRESAIEIGFVDGSSLVIGAEASLKIDAFVFDSDAAAGNASVTLSRGAMRWITGLMPSDNVRLETPTAAITIRGTTLKLGVKPNGDTIVALIEGLARVSTLDGQTSVDIAAGQSARVTQSGIEVVDLVLPVANAIVDDGWSRADDFSTGRDRNKDSSGGQSGGY